MESFDAKTATRCLQFIIRPGSRGQPHLHVGGGVSSLMLGPGKESADLNF